MAAICLENIGKVYSGGYTAVRDLSLSIQDGEFLVLVGPSGCGKSTTLRMIAGLESPTQGKLFIDGADVTALPPQQRDLAMVFQSYALYPHKTVRQNLEFGLRMRGVPANVMADRVRQVADVLGLEPFLQRRPGQLSGGQRQRVALGRAMVRQPKAFLLDEPLSNLDAKLRVQTRAELARMHRRLGATMIYVTHDQEEAMTLGDRIAVLHEGRLQQAAAPLDIYRRPANVFVAGFIGSPAMNLFPCALRNVDGKLRVESPWFRLSVSGDANTAAIVDATAGPAGRAVKLGIRPQDVRLSGSEEADAKGRVDVIQPLGSEILVHLLLSGQAADTPLTMVLPAESQLRPDQLIALRFPPERIHLFDADDGRRIG